MASRQAAISVGLDIPEQMDLSRGDIVPSTIAINDNRARCRQQRQHLARE